MNIWILVRNGRDESEIIGETVTLKSLSVSLHSHGNFEVAAMLFILETNEFCVEFLCVYAKITANSTAIIQFFILSQSF